MAIDIVILRNDIETALEGLIGEYNFPDNGIDIAIACLPDPDVGWNYPPYGTKVAGTGIEVVIKRHYPDFTPLIGKERLHSSAWEVCVKQWDTDGSLQDVIEKLKNLPSTYKIDRTSLIPSNNQLLIIEQYKLFLNEWEVSTVL